MSGNGSPVGSDAEFEEFSKSGDVEGAFKAPEGAEGEEGGDEKPAKRRGPPRQAPTGNAKDVGDGIIATGDYANQAGDGEEGDDGDEGGEEGADEKPKKTARDHQIERLKQEKRDLARQLREASTGATSALQARIDALEKGLPAGKGDDTKTAGTPAPDPTDATKYPLGHLDDRYIEDKLEWLAEQKATAKVDSVLQRQQESDADRQIREAAEREQSVLLTKVDALAEKGAELSEDFQELVVEAGMRGDWKLTQTTFEAAHDADNGAQILLDLANDHKEAARVASLPPLKQLAYVLDRDAEISGKSKPRTKPKAGDPPQHKAKGSNSRLQANPATNDLDDFEKQWERGSK
jgi:hypothetical protein